jgi:hypothetical protein
MTGNDEWARLEEGNKTHRPVMKFDKFEQVKIAQSHDIAADVIANELGLTLNEVNSAILAKTYDDYAKS